MSKPADAARRAARVLVLLLPVSALAGLTTAGGSPEPVARPSKAGADAFRLRCWQHGRLLFEEVIAGLPGETATRTGARIVATDAQGRPLQVTELQGTTCMVQAAHDDHPRLRER